MNAARTSLMGGALLLAATALFVWNGRGHQAAPAAVPTETAAHVAPWSAGDERAYSVRVDSNIAMSIGGGNPGAVRQVLTGRLALRAKDASTLDATLADADLTVAGTRDEVRSAEMRSPFVIELDPDGGVRTCRFAHGLDETVAGRLDELVRTFQLVGAAGSARRWTAREGHRGGSFEASYEQLDVRTLRKQRVRALTSDGQADPHVKIVASNARIGLDDGPWIASFDAQEEIETTTDNGEVHLVQHATLTTLPASGAVEAAFVSAEHAEVERREAEAAAEKLRIANEHRDPTSAERAQYDALLKALIESNGGDVQALLALRDLLKACPMLSQQVVESLRRHDVQGRAAAAVIHALELADHGPAHDALVAIFDDPAQEQLDRLRAIAAIGGAHDPEPAVVDRLWDVADARSVNEPDAERTDTARLSLGRLAASMHGEDRARSEAITDRLSATLDGAPDVARASAAIKALGNTGDPRAAAAVAARLNAPDPAVREAAAGALARLDPNGAVSVLADRLAREPNGRVRAAIVDALTATGDPGGAGVDAVAAQAARESDAGARSAMALYLAPRLGTRPALRPLLETMLQTEQDNRARKALAVALARGVARQR